MTVNSVDFTPFAAASLRIMLMGASRVLSRRVIDPACSLKLCEYVSADDLIDQEIAGRTAWGTSAARQRGVGRPVSDETMLAVMRRWFFSRKSNRGFVLAGFPVSVAQALVFDQWLDERDESLTACLWLAESGTSTAVNEVGENHVAAHYRDRGLLFTVDCTESLNDAGAGVWDLARALLADR